CRKRNDTLSLGTSVDAAKLASVERPATAAYVRCPARAFVHHHQKQVMSQHLGDDPGVPCRQIRVVFVVSVAAADHHHAVADLERAHDRTPSRLIANSRCSGVRPGWRSWRRASARRSAWVRSTALRRWASWRLRRSRYISRMTRQCAICCGVAAGAYSMGILRSSWLMP